MKPSDTNPVPADRTIVHMDLDTFFVSVERLLDSRIGPRPILIGSTSDRGVVASCSYEARVFGIHAGMPMRMARQLCPEAVVIRGSFDNYTKYSQLVTDIIREQVPLFEKSSIDEFYLDLSGMDRYFGCFKLASELRQKIMRESGLPISFGMSANKTVSKVATGEAKPNNQIQIVKGTEKPFLSPLSVKKIPMVGDKMYQTLRGLGVKYVGTVQEMPVELLERVFGQNGNQLWRKANGIDNSPVVSFHERKSLSTERTFERDTTDVVKLRGILSAMAEHLAFQLRKGQKLTACVTVKVRYSDFNTHTLQQHISYTSADHTLIQKVLELFDKLYNRRLLIRLVGIRFSDLVHGGYQINLFDDTQEMISLYKAMDNIRNRFGDRAVLRAAGMEATTIGRMNPYNGQKPSLVSDIGL